MTAILRPWRLQEGRNLCAFGMPLPHPLVCLRRTENMKWSRYLPAIQGLSGLGYRAFIPGLI